MSEQITKVPAIRFKGFTDPWEQRKLGLLTEVYDGTHQTPAYKSDGIMFLSVENIKTLHSEKFISKEAFDKDFKIRPESGDVLMTRIGDVGTANVIISDEPIAYYVSLALLKKKELDSYFLQTNIHTENVQNEIWKRTLHIAFPKKINKNEIENIPINYPCQQEQELIGNFSRNIDSLIILQQRELDLMKKQKQTLLSKMFPKIGERFPEIRFNGFTDSWEQCEFNNVFTYLQNNSLSRADLNYEHGSIKNIHYGDVLIKFGEIIDVEKSTIPFITDSDFVLGNLAALDNGDIIIADAAEDETVGKCTEITGLNDVVVVSGLHTIPCRPSNKYASGFMGYYMNSNAYHNQLLPLIQGTKISSISKRALKETKIIFPVSHKEQDHIGSFFNQLDNLITLQQRKLDQMKIMKKSLLKAMFV